MILLMGNSSNIMVVLPHLDKGGVHEPSGHILL